MCNAGLGSRAIKRGKRDLINFQKANNNIHQFNYINVLENEENTFKIIK